MLLEESEGALEGLLVAGLVEAGALVAGEAVAGGVDEDLDIRPGGLDLLDIAHGDAVVLLAEMQHDRHLRLLIRMSGDHPAVIADGGGDVLEARRREEGEGPAPAIADDADLADALQAVDRRLEIQQRVLELHLLAQLAAGLDVGGLVAD